MEESLKHLKIDVLKRKEDWESVKNQSQPTSVFVCNRRIQKLDEALQLISEIEQIDKYTERSK